VGPRCSQPSSAARHPDHQDGDHDRADEERDAQQIEAAGEEALQISDERYGLAPQSMAAATVTADHDGKTTAA
jgi:hypothetical protein